MTVCRAFTDGEIGQVGLQASFNPSSGHGLSMPLAQMCPLMNWASDQVTVCLASEVILNSSMTSDEVEQLLSGIAGSQVGVSIKNSEGQTRNLLLQRDLTKDNKLSVMCQTGLRGETAVMQNNSTKTQLLGALRQVNVPLRGVLRRSQQPWRCAIGSHRRGKFVR